MKQVHVSTHCHQPIATNQLPPTNCHRPICDQPTATQLHQPTATNQLSPTNCHQPIATNQTATDHLRPNQLPTNQPVPATNYHQPIVVNQLSPTNSTHLPPTNCHQQTSTHKLTKGDQQTSTRNQLSPLRCCNSLICTAGAWSDARPGVTLVLV